MLNYLTDRSRLVLRLAKAEADRVGDNYVGTEHLLIALAEERTGVAGFVLSEHGLTVEILRAEVENLIAFKKGAAK